MSECGTCQDRRLVGGFMPQPCPSCAGGVSVELVAALRDERDKTVARVEVLEQALREAIDLAEEANGDPSSCSYSVPVGDRLLELATLIAPEEGK